MTAPRRPRSAWLLVGSTPSISLKVQSAYVTSGPRNWGQYYANTGERFYRAQDIGVNGRTREDAKQYLVPPGGMEGRHARVTPGDVLVVITGATVGRVALVLPSHEPGFVSQHVALCRVPQDALVPEYLAMALLAPGGQEQLLASRYGQGKPGLNLGNVLNVRLPVPDVARQREVVAKQAAILARNRRLELLREKVATEIRALMVSTLAGVLD